MDSICGQSVLDLKASQMYGVASVHGPRSEAWHWKRCFHKGTV